MSIIWNYTHKSESKTGYIITQSNKEYDRYRVYDPVDGATCEVDGSFLKEAAKAGYVVMDSGGVLDCGGYFMPCGKALAAKAGLRKEQSIKELTDRAGNHGMNISSIKQRSYDTSMDGLNLDEDFIDEVHHLGMTAMDALTGDQQTALNAYIMWFSRKAWLESNQKLGKLNTECEDTDSKLKESSRVKLQEIARASNGKNWIYGGQCFLLANQESECSLGHPLTKQVHFAMTETMMEELISPENFYIAPKIALTSVDPRLVRFGSKCVGDFFHLGDDAQQVLHMVGKLINRDLAILDSVYSDKTLYDKVLASFEVFNAFIHSILTRRVGVDLSDIIPSDLQTVLSTFERVNSGASTMLLYPPSLLKYIRDTVSGAPIFNYAYAGYREPNYSLADRFFLTPRALVQDKTLGKDILSRIDTKNLYARKSADGEITSDFVTRGIAYGRFNSEFCYLGYAYENFVHYLLTGTVLGYNPEARHADVEQGLKAKSGYVACYSTLEGGAGKAVIRRHFLLNKMFPTKEDRAKGIKSHYYPSFPSEDVRVLSEATYYSLIFQQSSRIFSIRTSLEALYNTLGHSKDTANAFYKWLRAKKENEGLTDEGKGYLCLSSKLLRGVGGQDYMQTLLLFDKDGKGEDAYTECSKMNILEYGNYLTELRGVLSDLVLKAEEYNKEAEK